MTEAAAVLAAQTAVRFRELVEEALIGVYVSTPGGRLLFCNTAFATMLGFRSAEQAAGTSLAALYATSADRDRFIERVRASRRLDPHRTRLRRADGHFIDVLESVVGEFGADGGLVALRGQVIDISTLIAVEAALHERDDQFRAVFSDAADGILILDATRTIADANPAARELFAIDADDIGRRTLDAVLPVDAAVDRLWVELLAMGEVKREHRIARPNGSPVTLECSYRAHGHGGRYLCVARDITERRQLEERQLLSDKIASVSRLAGGIAHDFNNLLTAVLGYTELLLASKRPADPDCADLVEIRKAAERGAALTRQLLAFGRKQVLVPKDVDLAGVVEELRPMLARLVREDITIVVQAAPEPAPVSIDATQFEQALINLVINARDAMPDGGRIVISVAPVEIGPGDEVSGAPAGHYVRVRVADDGTGMPAEVRKHLFEPFFTTKAFGTATGLGLASVHGTVRQSNGYITVESEPGAGTAVTMHFPARATEARAAGDIPLAAVTSGATILLVEDEDAVRAIVGAVLRRHGFHVLEASTPRGACDIFAVHRDAIDLLLTDVVMPEMNGPALAQRLVSERPELRVLFISGYADVAASAIDSNKPNIAFLSKPFQAAALVACVREILGRPRVQA